MDLLIIIAGTLLLVSVSVSLHYEILHTASERHSRLARTPRTTVIVVIGAALTGHVLQIIVYALTGSAG